ncbi:MAG: hypothetical protein WA609_03495 [Terriglobales bacterium]
MALTRPVHCRPVHCKFEVTPSGKLWRILLILIAAGALALLCACGAQNSMAPAITVTFTPGFTPPTAMTVSEQCGVAATVTNDSKNQGVTWKATCGSASCGTFTPTAASASAEPITYTSPAVAPTGGTVTLIATSVTDPTKNATSAAIPIGQNSAGCTVP